MYGLDIQSYLRQIHVLARSQLLILALTITTSPRELARIFLTSHRLAPSIVLDEIASIAQTQTFLVHG
jgi:hypothetical protein